MKHQPRTIIIKAAVAAALLLSFVGNVFAHGGFEHVRGTIAKVEAGVMTVKTDKGDVAVKFDEKTEITKMDKKAEVADLVIGSRVIVDLPEKVKDPVAHSIKIGAAAPAETHEHADHK